MTRDPEVIWSSDQEDIATVSDQGVATGLAAGKTTITAADVTDPTVSAAATLDITNPIITALALDPETASIPVGKTQLIKGLST